LFHLRVSWTEAVENRAREAQDARAYRTVSACSHLNAAVTAEGFEEHAANVRIDWEPGYPSVQPMQEDGRIADDWGIAVPAAWP
jgi:hypothetical protein